MITNQNNNLDKNHKSIAMIKSPPHRKNARPIHLQSIVQQPTSEVFRKQLHVTFREGDVGGGGGGGGDSRGHRESATSQVPPSSNTHCKQSRIPTTTTTTRNFNQISKAPTNLWNEIYEKHLLNQTKFEHGITVDDKWTNKCASNGRKKQRDSGVSNTQPTETNFNNNLCQNELRPALALAPTSAALTPALVSYESNVPFALLRRHIDPELTFAEAHPTKKNAKIRLTNRPPIPYNEPHHFHKQINNFASNGCVTASGRKPFFAPLEKVAVTSNDLHLLPQQQTMFTPAANVRHFGPYAYSSGIQIPNEMGIVYMQPSIIEKNLFYQHHQLQQQHHHQQQQHLTQLQYNGHNKQIKSEINDPADCQLHSKNTGVLNQAYNRISGNICLERGQPVGGNHREDSSVGPAFSNGVTASTVPATATATAKMASLSVVSAANASKVQCNTFENAITTSTSLSGGESTLPTNSDCTTNSKINIMLETAQAMAAAAYFARLVSYTQ